MMSSMKPAPLQFVKLAPSDLYRSAQDQLNKAAVVTKPKPKEFDAEWQSDLDNWKSNRRKQQEHIIERLVEVKKFETDRLDDGFRKRSKTFNEMIQERGRSGRLRSLPALYQDDDDGNDLSDLGLSTGKKSSVDGDDDGHRGGRGVSSTEDKCGREDEDVFRGAENPVAASAAAKTATVTTTAATAENGFDRAIKDYVDFAESKRTSVAVKCENPQQQQTRRKPLAAEMKRRMSAPKIEEKVMLLKTRSQSTKDLHSAAAAELPKVDIGKRREIFEKAAAEIQQQPPQLAKKKPLETPPPVSVARTGGPQDIRRQVIEEISPPGSPPSPTENGESTKVVDRQQLLKLQHTSYFNGSDNGSGSGEEEPSEPPQQQYYGRPAEALQREEDAVTAAVQDVAAVMGDSDKMVLQTAAVADDQEKPIVALEKERVVLRDDGYGLHHHHHNQQPLSSLSDLVSRHSIDSLDQECGGLPDPDDGNYPGSCLSAEDSGIHTEDMSSCVSQADDEEQRSNLQPSPVHQHSQVPDAGAALRHDPHRHVDDAYTNMVLELTPVNALEPPKEKPPPPPVDAYPDDDQVQPSQELAEDGLELAKRIKKEMWMKRSSFLGLEEYTNNGYEHDLENLKSKPPDLTSFLEEERRLEKLLYNQNKPERHDNTRIYENVSSIPTQNVYMDDGGDSESSQYMRDILQVEEQSRCNQLKNKAAQNNIGEKLVKKLKELEEDLNNQESARVGSAHWLPPTRHSMQDISTTNDTAVNAPRPPLDHTQSMPNLEQPVQHCSQHHQPEDFIWSVQNICPKPAQQSNYAKRKPTNSQPEKYNYQHWLIQEAEHRRLVDKCNRQVIPPGAIASNQPRSRSRPSLPPPPPPSHNKKPLPDSVINTLTQRVQDRLSFNDVHRHDHISSAPQESMLSVSGKKKCSHCLIELGRGAAMIIESLQLFYHIDCFKCCVCCIQLGDGLMGTDVRVRNKKLHCHNCFSSDDGVKFSCV